MRSIDVHAHHTPQCLWKAVDAGREWYGLTFEAGDGLGYTVREGRRSPIPTPKLRFSPEERIRDMDQLGVDVHVVSVSPNLFSYHLDPAQGVGLARDTNDEIGSMVRGWPQRFAGLATLPAQDVEASVAELERAVNVLSLKGAELDTSVNGQTWDEPQFLPLFKAAEAMGALLFFHPAGSLVWGRTGRYHLGNTIGNTLEDTLVVAALIFGGILEKCPDLKVCIAHGGGPACFGMGRMDRGWQVRSEARVNILKPPRAYQRLIYYDCLTHSEAALRFMLDQVGADRVVLGSDWPYDMGFDSPVEWVQGLESLTQDEKESILWKNLEELLGL